MIRLRLAVTIPLLAMQTVLPATGHAQPTPFDIDVKELDRPAPSPSSRKAEKVKAPHRRKESAAKVASHERPRKHPYLTYTVRPGDYLFKILITRFGMSNDEAEKLIPEIIRLNKINNIRDLEVGSKLLIPGHVQAHPQSQARTRPEQPPRDHREAEPAAILEKAPNLEAEGMAPGGGTATLAPAPAAVPIPPQTPPAGTAGAAGAAPPPVTWLCPAAAHDAGGMVDAILSALSISWCRNRIVESDHSASIPFSIRVDRYFERKGGRYVVSIGKGDARSDDSLRLLEKAGYRVAKIGAQEDFKSVGEKLLTLIGVVPDYGVHELQGGKEVTGFLVQPEEAGGRRVVISKGAVEGAQKWVMAPGCGSR